MLNNITTSIENFLFDFLCRFKINHEICSPRLAKSVYVFNLETNKNKTELVLCFSSDVALTLVSIRLLDHQDFNVKSLPAKCEFFREYVLKMKCSKCQLCCDLQHAFAQNSNRRLMFLQLSNALNKSHKIARYHYYAYHRFDFHYNVHFPV